MPSSYDVDVQPPSVANSVSDDDKGVDLKELEAAAVTSAREYSASNEDGNKLIHHFVPITSYEGYHRFDPEATWTEEEENKLIKKVDIRIFLWVLVMFFALQLDRGQ
jgi:hypothetical protein